MSVNILNTFLFFLGMMENFFFLQVPHFVVGNFYSFNILVYLYSKYTIKINDFDNNFHTREIKITGTFEQGCQSKKPYYLYLRCKASKL